MLSLLKLIPKQTTELCHTESTNLELVRAGVNLIRQQNAAHINNALNTLCMAGKLDAAFV